MDIEIGVKGQRETEKKLIKGMRQQQNRRAINLKAAIAYHGWVLKNFASEGKHSGKPWKPLKQSTIDRRKKGKGKGSAKILQDTGQLRQRWTIGANKKRGLVRSAAKSDSNIFYSSFHEKGKGVPKRKIFPTKKVGLEITRKVYQMHIDKTWRNF